MKDLHVNLGNAVDFLSGERGRPPTPAELADHLGISVEDVLEALEAGGAYRAAPLTAPSDDDDGHREGTALRDEDMVLAGADDRILVRQLLSTLPERERTIVELRFYAGLSQSEIAERVGVSQVHVSRLLRSSLAALQRAAGDQAGSLSHPSSIERVPVMSRRSGDGWAGIDDSELNALRLQRLAAGEQRPEPGRIQERQTARVDEDGVDAAFGEPVDLGRHRVDAVEVELAARVSRAPCVPRRRSTTRRRGGPPPPPLGP